MSSGAARFFGDRADNYDDFIPRIVPQYHECNALMVDLAPFPRESRLRMLDIGAGTGVLSELLLTAFPNASILAFDLSADMLATCKARLEKFGSRVDLRQGTFPVDDFGSGFDLVVSSLALHHLEDSEKGRGFQIVANKMRAGGSIIVRDLIKAASATLENQYEELWQRYVADQGQDDLSWFEAHRVDDRPATIEDNLRWLEQAGFVDVGCHWRYLGYAVFGGRKPPGNGSR